jgi:hypothetical protein
MNKIKSQLNCNKTTHIIWDESNNFTRIESVGTFKMIMHHLQKKKTEL